MTRAESIEQALLERHNALLRPQDFNQLSQQSPKLSDQNLSDGPQFNSDILAYEPEDNESDNDIQYLETQARS